jgi:hypothetical protein
MDSKTESDQCYNELIKQIKKLFIDIQLQNHLKERLQRDNYQYMYFFFLKKMIIWKRTVVHYIVFRDIYGQLAEYHEAISSLIHSISHNLVKAGNAEQVQKTSDKGKYNT